MAQVVLEHIDKVYPGGFKAVHDLNLHIRDQEFIVFVGPSGCGKSTTLRIVAGLEEVTSGQVKIGDRVVTNTPPKDRDIAMVFQNYALYPHMSVYSNMAFGLKLRKIPKPEIQKRIEWAAGILGLSNLLERKPKALSGGQRQRVALGRAIVRQPQAFLFDEPLSNLDAKLRVETRAELKRLHKRLLTTTIYVTHDQEEAMTLGDRVVVMDGGYIQQCDAPLTIYNAPVNRFVAGFLGTPPMNFLEGKIEENNGMWFVGAGIELRLSEAQSKCLAGKAGQAVVLGIRPETMGLADAASATKGETITVNVSVIETLGSHMDVFGQTPGDSRLVARIPANPSVMDATQLTFRVGLEHVHVFEPGTHGKNLTLQAVAAK